MKNKIKKDIKGLTLTELEEYFVNLGERKYRAKQVYRWLYNQQLHDFSQMENIPQTLRDKLNENISLDLLNKIDARQSDSSGTVKLLFQTGDGNKIETVVIPNESRTTVCISTQVGCPLDCKFCATGLMGYKRNLTSGEIIEQYIQAQKYSGEVKITNIVFMGMGEPLLNFANTLKSLEIFTDDLAFGLGRNKLTVSTSGIPNNIIKLADSGLRVKLALSLHSAFEDVRGKLMPINLKYSLAETMNSIEYYYRTTRDPVTYEYLLLKGINDTEKDVAKLTKLARRVPSKINLIPFNSIAHMTPGGISAELEPTSKEGILEFSNALRNNGLQVNLRDTRGDDIAAACGQLANAKL